MKLLGTNRKLMKGEVKILGLSLAPSTVSGHQLCPRASTADSPANLDFTLECVEDGHKVSVPGMGKELPDEWLGHPVDDGDVDDAWWVRLNLVQWLRFKGHQDPNGGCKVYCINLSGCGRMKGVQEARIRKSKMLFEDRPRFLNLLYGDIETAAMNAEEGGYQLYIRPNVFSDVPWETRAFGAVPQRFPTVEFRDYTKIERRMRRYRAGDFPENYKLCFSYNKVWVAVESTLTFKKGMK